MWFISRSDWEGCWCCRFFWTFPPWFTGPKRQREKLSPAESWKSSSVDTCGWGNRMIFKMHKKTGAEALGCELNPLHNSYVAQCSMFVNPGWRLGLCEILWVLWWITSIRRVCLATHSPPRCPLKHGTRNVWPCRTGFCKPSREMQVVERGTKSP